MLVHAIETINQVFSRECLHNISPDNPQKDSMYVSTQGYLLLKKLLPKTGVGIIICHVFCQDNDPIRGI